MLGIEARGFILAAPVAYRMGAGFVPVRKAGKLPWAVVREEYSLEYGTGQARDPPRRHPSRRADPGDRRRARHRRHGGRHVRLVEALGGVVVGLGFLIEIEDLGGRAGSAATASRASRGTEDAPMAAVDRVLPVAAAPETARADELTPLLGALPPPPPEGAGRR